MRPMVAACLASLMIVPAAFAQSFTTAPCSGDSNQSWWGSKERVCESRQTTLPLAGGELSVTGKNGGIEVTGEDRNDVALEAQVTAAASSHEEAERLVHEVRIETNGTIHAEGPSTGNWSVNFKLRVPKHLAAKLQTQNGGIGLANLDGTVNAETTNGGISLNNMSGDVHATTTNGGLHISLTGDSWHGAGLVAKSTNGGVHMTVPENYSAHLIAGTVNGGTSVHLPMTANVMNSRRHIDGQIGHGGPTVQVETVNGGVSID
jgi:DUF4097 and DUF4098 domain-containing protein YvlB